MENLLEQAVLTEAFDTIEGYNVVNMKPGSASPQIFLIKNGEDNNLIVRMMALGSGGDKLRVLKPNDKNVIVELMSINERGRHIVLKGGIGKDPMKTIVTIFDTVMANLNLAVVDSIMFRFQPRKMKGQVRAVTRILERLAKTRGKGKFVPLDEMEQFTSKFAYVVMHKRRLDLDKLPGAENVPEKYTTTETKVGDVYINSETGKQVSKSEVVADAIANTISKISDKEMVQKTKLSKLEIIKAQYNNTVEMTPSKRAKFEELDQKTIAKTPPSDMKPEFYDLDRFAKFEIDENEDLSSFAGKSLGLLRNSDKSAYEKLDEFENGDGYGYYNIRLHEAGIKFNDMIKINEEIHKNMSELTLENSYDTMAKFVTMLDQYKNDSNEDEIAIARDTIFRNFLLTVERKMTAAYEDGSSPIPRDDSDKLEALADYCTNSYSDVNGALQGTLEATTETTETIEYLDDIFENNYEKIPKNVKLYRAMSLRPTEVKTAFESKVFYFRNYVSTSLIPIIFSGSFGTDVTPHIQKNADSTDTETIDDVIYNLSDGDFSVTVGMVISGADKLNVVIPYQYTSFPNECEVILPRGIAIKFDRVARNFESGNPSLFAECSIIDPESLTESDEVIDGDHLVETGEMKRMELTLSNVVTQTHLADIESRKAVSMEYYAGLVSKAQFSSKFG